MFLTGSQINNKQINWVAIFMQINDPIESIIH